MERTSANFQQKKFNKKTFFLNFVGNLFFVYCVIVGLALVLFSSVTIECVVVGPSMQPTLNKDLKMGQDVVYVNKYSRDFSYGDIVVVDTLDGSDPIIKRVIGVGGDEIDVVETSDGYKLEINGKIIEEGYIKKYFDVDITSSELRYGNAVLYDRFQTMKENFPELFVSRTVGDNLVAKLVVPTGEVFVLGDNRDNSQDSTHYGTFKESQLFGIVEKIRHAGDSEFLFYWDYIIKGQFLVTIANCF